MLQITYHHPIVKYLHHQFRLCRPKQKKYSKHYAISSEEWIKYWEAKDKEKQDKEEKKLARAEKRKINQELKIKKCQQPKQRQVKKRKTVVYSESSDSEDDEVLSKVAERNNMSTKKREDKYEVGKYVIVKYEGEYFPGVVQQE